MMSKLVPKLRFKEFSGEWEEKKLGDISEIVRGGSPRPIDNYMTLDKYALNWLKIADVDKNSKYVTFTKERVKKTALSKTREVYLNDLILSNSMSFGRPYIMKIKSCIHDGWIAITNILKDIDTHYLYYMILSPVSQKFFIDYAGGGGIRNLNADIIKSLPTLFPKSPKEQQKIANTLSSLDSLIEAQQRKVEALKKHKKGLMQQLFPAEGANVPKLRFKEFSGEWEEKKLGDICKKTSSNISANKLNESKGDYKVYGAGGYLQNVDFYTEEKPYISIIKDGSGVGKVFLCEAKSSVLGTLQIITPKNDNNLIFLYSIMIKINFSKYITGATIPHIYFKDYSNETIYLPPPKEQQKIANTLSSLDSLLEAQQRKVEALKKHKKGLMQQMFVSGED